MPKQIYIDSQGNEIEVSGTINTGALLPMSGSDNDKVADRITALESGIGNIISGTISGTVSCANNTVTEVGSITLNIGRYLIIACIDWATNATGFRQVSFGNSINPARSGASTTSACSGKETYNQGLEFLTVTNDNTVVKFYGWQDSGSSLNAYPYIYAMKIN